ncbi:retention module-containing protein, partial [Vreelandella venusta]|uniref:retention module-containing protein n=1 Tax=Vreelandella venusta TaxID=44935 RepID=UPI003C2F7D4A
MDTLIIEAISGNAWVRDSNGNIRELREGDIVQPGETIITDANASVIVSTPQGMALQLPSGSELSHADIVLRSPEPDEGIRFSEAEKASKAEVQLEEQLEEQRITQLDSAPLSQGSSSAPIISKDGLTFVMLERIELPLPPLAYAYNYERGDEPLYRLNGWEGASERFEPRTSALAVRVELAGANDDGTYSQDEIGNDGTVTAQVTLGEGTQVGDTLIVTDKDGNVLFDGEVTQDDLDNGVTVEVPVSPGDTDVSVTATVTDPDGNSSSDDDSKPIEPIDDVPPAVSVELTGSGDDGTYSQDEIGDDGTVTAQVTLEDGTEVGDTLVVTDKDGNVLDEREVTQDDLDNGVSVEVPVSPGDTDVSVTATVTDPAGNSSSDDDSKPIEPVDNTSPAVSVELTGSGDDGTYSQDEIGNDGTVTAQVTLEDGTEVGDTLVVTDKDGNVLDEREVTQDDLDNGVSVEVPVSPGDTDVSVTATVTDPDGNSSSDDDSKPIEPIDDVPPA